MLQHLEQHPSEARLQAFNGQRAQLDVIDRRAQGANLFGTGVSPAGVDGRKVAQQIITLKPAIAFASDIACGQHIAGRLAIRNGQPGEQALERAAQVARCAMESICNVERLKGRIPTIKDAIHQHR